MNIVVHYPKDQVNIDILMKRVAAIHADAAIRYIEKLRCPKEQKIALVNSLMNKGLRQ